MTEADVIAANDRDRTFRSFINFVATASGDQTLAAQDGIPANMPGAYQSVGTWGGDVAVEGKPLSTAQNRAATAATPAMMLLLLGVVAFFALKG
jgi:hypothetical protein